MAATNPQQDPLVGHTVGRYEIKAYIGDEQLGKVYAANQLPGNELVTLKVLHPHLCDDQEVLGRFGREMLATATIEHANTVKMLDFGDHRGVFHYLVLEALDARPLSEEIEQNGPLSADRVAHIAAQIARALTAAHTENIVHRNLSPQSILLLNNVLEGDYVKVRDFGLAKLQNEASDATLTAVGARVGTTQYMAPEYISHGEVDPRGDLYALGCVMYEMLTGEPPYDGRAGEVIEAHITGAIPRASAKAKRVPAWLDDLVVQLLAKEPEERPRNAAELLRMLQEGTNRRLDPPHLMTLDESATLARRQSTGGATVAKASLGIATVAVALGGLVLVGAVVALIAAVLMVVLSS